MRQSIAILSLALLMAAALPTASVALPECGICNSICSGDIMAYKWITAYWCNGCGVRDLWCKSWCGQYLDGAQECWQLVYEANSCGYYC